MAKIFFYILLLRFSGGARWEKRKPFPFLSKTTFDTQVHLLDSFRFFQLSCCIYHNTKMSVQNSEAELVAKVKGLRISHKEDIEVSHQLVGCYNWAEQGAVYIPGFPLRLRKDWKRVKVGRLPEKPATKEEVHPNEFRHSIYFEPLEEVLKYRNSEDSSSKLLLENFDLVTVRNNLRKIDAALSGNKEHYQDFEILLRRKGSKLVLAEREELEYAGTTTGRAFEERLCEKSDFTNCHAIVHTTINTSTKVYNLLVRCEVHCCLPSVSTPPIEGYKSRKTASGLSVFTAKGYKSLELQELGEIKMSGRLTIDQIFQCWLGGIQWVAHGVNLRNRTMTQLRQQEQQGFKERLLAIVREILDRAQGMEKDKTYYLKRVAGGELQFGAKSNYNKQWLA